MLIASPITLSKCTHYDSSPFHSLSFSKYFFHSLSLSRFLFLFLSLLSLPFPLPFFFCAGGFTTSPRIRMRLRMLCTMSSQDSHSHVIPTAPLAVYAQENKLELFLCFPFSPSFPFSLTLSSSMSIGADFFFVTTDLGVGSL